MDRIVIQGGRRLAGEVLISGAKNAALPLLASTLLSRDECVISNVPRLQDVATILKLLRHLGAAVREEGNGVVGAAAPSRGAPAAPDELV
jgi:UDP-N-acetylglucosamine 1-carboxyvinyltransferase